MALAIGHPAYISGLPVSYAFEQGLLDAGDLQSITALPDELDAKMAAGELVAGAISSLEYIRNGDRYSLIKDLSIGSWGRIGSSILVSRVPFNRLGGETVVLPSHGTTSNALTRWMLAKMFGVEAAYVQAEGSLAELLERYPAALLIGDQAVVEAKAAQELRTIDMGESWWQAMHTPFVHTVWVCQADLPRPERERLSALFQQAKALGKEHHGAIVDIAAERLGLPKDEIEAYYALLNFDLTPAHMQGLGFFANYLDEVESTTPA